MEKYMMAAFLCKSYIDWLRFPLLHGLSLVGKCGEIRSPVPRISVLRTDLANSSIIEVKRCRTVVTLPKAISTHEGI